MSTSVGPLNSRKCGLTIKDLEILELLPSSSFSPNFIQRPWLWISEGPGATLRSVRSSGWRCGHACPVSTLRAQLLLPPRSNPRVEPGSQQKLQKSIQVWIKTALNNFHNEAGHLTTESNTPAFSDLPGNTGESVCLIFFPM